MWNEFRSYRICANYWICNLIWRITQAPKYRPSISWRECRIFVNCAILTRWIDWRKWPDRGRLLRHLRRSLYRPEDSTISPEDILRRHRLSWELRLHHRPISHSHPNNRIIRIFTWASTDISSHRATTNVSVHMTTKILNLHFYYFFFPNYCDGNSPYFLYDVDLTSF